MATTQHGQLQHDDGIDACAPGRVDAPQAPHEIDRRGNTGLYLSSSTG